MIKAVRFEILRGIESDSRARHPVSGVPVRVATLMDEAAFTADQILRHHRSVFLEDKLHDWDYRDGMLRYYARTEGRVDVLVVYEIQEV